MTQQHNTSEPELPRAWHPVYGDVFITSTIRPGWPHVSIKFEGQYEIYQMGYGRKTVKGLDIVHHRALWDKAPQVGSEAAKEAHLIRMGYGAKRIK